MSGGAEQGDFLAGLFPEERQPAAPHPRKVEKSKPLVPEKREIPPPKVLGFEDYVRIFCGCKPLALYWWKKKD